MEVNFDVLPSNFIELYNLASEVENVCRTGRLTYSTLYTSQELLSLYVSLVETTPLPGNVGKSNFESLVKEYKDTFSKVKSVSQTDMLLAMARLSQSILQNIKNTASLVRGDISAKKYAMKEMLKEKIKSDVIYMTRLAVTYQKYFDDKYILKSNDIWREYAPLINLDPMILKFPQTTKVIAGAHWDLYMAYWGQKIDALISRIKEAADFLERVDRYESPDSTEYKNDFMQTFALNAVKVSIPLPIKEEKEGEPV